MTKLKKKASGSRRQDSGKTHKHVPEARSPKPEASIEDQIAALEAQIALLRDEGVGGRGQGVGKRNLTSHPSPLTPDPSPLPRAKLAAPTNLDATAFGSSFLRVSWGSVTNASGYLVQYSSDSAFVNDVNAVMVDAPGASVTLSGLRADTMYHVKVKSIAFEGDTDSEFSMPYLVRTGIATNAETATHLQTWLDDQQTLLQNASVLVPEIENTVLTTSERRRLLGSGVRRYGFIDKVSDTAVAYSQFWPDYVGDNGEEQLKTLIREIEVLRNLLVFYESGARTMQDLLLIKGDAALRLATTYYVTAREAARRQVPDAAAVFQLLKLFWHRRRNTSAEPTQKETMRNFKAMMRGTREGEMFIENESDSVTKGKRTVVDNTRKKPRNNFKEVETGEVDSSADCADECR
jgi:hypothetical protein